MGTNLIIKIVAGGPLDRIPNLQRNVHENEMWIAVDAGVEHLSYFSIVPDYAIGDFDTYELLPSVRVKEIERFSSEKDETDLELALRRALEYEPKKVEIFGATGGRLDHELVNIHLLSIGLEAQVPIEIIDKQNRLVMKQPGTYEVDQSKFTYVSFLSFSDIVTGLTLEGFKYSLNNKSIMKNTSLCISNELTKKKGTYSFDSGILIVIESRD